MEKRSILIGAALIGMGLLSLVFSAVTHLFGWDLFGFAVRLWPAVVIGLGMLLVLAPLAARRHRGLGALWIPGFPVLITGSILFLASVFGAWGMWAWVWPMELLALAMGFMLAAAWARLPGLAVPGIILGINGLVMQFCAITGLWSWWSVLWVVEPLAVGLALLALGSLIHKSGPSTAGLILCSIAAAGLVLMVTILGGWWPLRLAASGLIIFLGILVLAWSLLRPRMRVANNE